MASHPRTDDPTASDGRPDPWGPHAESRPGLLRALGPVIAVSMVVGNVIGSGIFAKPGEIAAEVAHFPTIAAAWILGGVICALGAFCFAELAAMLPRAGGLYVYLREAYGRPAAFLFGWSEFLFGKPASNGALAVIFIGALCRAAGWQPGIVPSVSMAIALIAAMAWVNVLGVVWGGRVQAGTTLVKAGFLAAVALLPFVLAACGSVPIGSENYASTIDPAGGSNAARFAAAMLAVLWAYNGWHGVTPVAEEIRNPQRNLPLALLAGLGILIVLYLGANLAYHGVLSMDEMAASGENAAQNMIAKLLNPFGENWANVGVATMSAVIMCSTFGAINSNILSVPRIAFAMGRDDVFFRGLGRVHVNYRTPAIAIVSHAALASGLLIATGAYVSSVGPSETEEAATSASGTASPAPDARKAAMSETFQLLTNLVVFSASLFYMAAVAAVIVLRRRRSDWQRPFRTPGYPLVPAAYLTFYAWFLYYVYIERPVEANVGLLLVAAGIPAYFGYRRWAAGHPERLHDGM